MINNKEYNKLLIFSLDKQSLKQVRRKMGMSSQSLTMIETQLQQQSGNWGLGLLAWLF